MPPSNEPAPQPKAQQLANPEKRKTPPDPTSQSRKRTKIYDARTLAVQSSDAALSHTGELDVSAFIAAREYEIRALETGIRNSKNALTSRAFQKVPRSLRRRTASHNVKRVPRRLRARARREMVEDNTPTVTARRRKPTEQLRLRLETARRLQNLNARSKARRAAKRAAGNKAAPLAAESEHMANIAPRVPKIKKNKLSHPEKPTSKYKKRQRGKTWLPTHMFHAKRARMTEPKAPLWRFAIPLTPTEKSYRPTHRANGARGAIAWDMSYISTIGLEGVEASIEGLLKAMGVDGDGAWANKGRKWRTGSRSLQTWLFERDGAKLPIAPVILLWCVPDKAEEVEMVDADKPSLRKKPPKRKMFIRVHPSAFLQLWEELLKVSKIQKPPVMLEDLRFEIGSIELSGPGSTETLLAALNSVSPLEGSSRPPGCPEEVWKSLTGLTNPASLPLNALLAFNISDPRLRYPPRTVKPPNSEESLNNLTMLLSSWSPDATQSRPELFSRPTRLAASRLLPSQKAINRRKALAPPGQYPSPKLTDPQIPIILLASRSVGGSSKHTNSQGRWTILLPWKCVAPVWYSIMYYPLSSGGNPRFGGVYEQQQLAFESGEAWFPGDFPGTRAGWSWEVRQRELQKDQWERKPKGKRVEFDSVNLGNGRRGEIGRGWACDWERLVAGPPKMDEEDKAASSNDATGKKKTQLNADQKVSDSKENLPIPPLEIHHLAPSAAALILSRKTKSECLPSYLQALLLKPALATVTLNLVNRGTPVPRARIYRLPTTSPSLRNQWLSLLNDSSSTSSKDPVRPSYKGLQIRHKNQQNTTQEPQTHEILLPPLLPSGCNEPFHHIPLPDEADLIGFVTTGNYNLSGGRGTGIGAILVGKVEVYTPPSPSSSSPDAGDADNEQARNGVAMKMGKEKLTRMCIVRAAGESVGRLGWWEI
ncbi:Ribonucleases P/MRP protein subunit pop1 [Emydomyces testavorans]|uniref:Ribonucleases P/MRP protein subunit pop1 n=1 Tax=Emydomyces testavorans TaxID=2070801 RepID=A0AAF0IHD5_9EURO|nr:Ribonucleases P/MRP protein subunit pop1 [Emydomyces testavorans]